MKKLMDIYTKNDVDGNKTRMVGRVLVDKDNHFEGIIREDSDKRYRLVVGDMIDEKDLGLVELIIFRNRGDNRPSLKLEGEKVGFKFLGKSYLKTDEVKAEYGKATVSIYDGDMIREVTDEEIESVQKLTQLAREELNIDSLNIYMSLSAIKQYRKRMLNR